MKTKEEAILDHLPKTSFNMKGNKYKDEPNSYYTNAWGLIIFPFLAFIGVLYLIFKVLL